MIILIFVSEIITLTKYGLNERDLVHHVANPSSILCPISIAIVN